MIKMQPKNPPAKTTAVKPAPAIKKAPRHPMTSRDVIALAAYNQFTFGDYKPNYMSPAAWLTHYDRRLVQRWRDVALVAIQTTVDEMGWITRP